MKFVEIEVIVGDEKSGVGTAPFLLNVESPIIGVIKAGVPGDLAGPDGNPIVVEKAALDVGVKLVMTNHTVEELLEKLEGIQE